MRFQIIAIRTKHPHNTYESITHYKLSGGTVINKEKAVRWINNNRDTMFVNETKETEVVVISSKGFLTESYLRTQPDCLVKNNLLNLPRF